MLIQQYVKFGKKYGPMMMDLWNNPQDKDKIIERYRPQFMVVKEGYLGDTEIDDRGAEDLAGLGAGLLVLYVVIGIILFGIFIWNIVALVHYWKRLDTVWKVLGLVFLLLGMSPISLILIYVGKSSSHQNGRRHDDGTELDDRNDDRDDRNDDRNDDRGDDSSSNGSGRNRRR